MGNNDIDWYFVNNHIYPMIKWFILFAIFIGIVIAYQMYTVFT